MKKKPKKFEIEAAKRVIKLINRSDDVYDIVRELDQLITNLVRADWCDQLRRHPLVRLLVSQLGAVVYHKGSDEYRMDYQAAKDMAESKPYE
jgi:hypothetical protein